MLYSCFSHPTENMCRPTTKGHFALVVHVIFHPSKPYIHCHSWIHGVWGICSAYPTVRGSIVVVFLAANTLRLPVSTMAIALLAGLISTPRMRWQDLDKAVQGWRTYHDWLRRSFHLANLFKQIHQKTDGVQSFPQKETYSEPSQQ